MGLVAALTAVRDGLRIRPGRGSLGRAAARYAAAGWDVLPGACLRGRRFDCGRTACRTVGCHPAVDDWESVATSDRATVASWWRALPFTVLLTTGRAFDVLEVPAMLAGAALAGAPLRSLGNPVAVTPDHRWMFFVRPGTTLVPELSGRADVVLHGTGSWVPAPPTHQPDGRVRWLLAPRAVGYQVAGAGLVQSLLAASLTDRRVSRVARRAAGPARPAGPAGPVAAPPTAGGPGTLYRSATADLPQPGAETARQRGPAGVDRPGWSNESRRFGRAARRAAAQSGQGVHQAGPGVRQAGPAAEGGQRRK